MAAAKRSILVVEDEPKLRRLVELQLADDGYDVKSAPDAESALKLVNEGAFDLVITDLKLPKMSGLEFLQEVKRSDPQMPVVIMTAFGSVESAVDAMKAGRAITY